MIEHAAAKIGWGGMGMGPHQTPDLVAGLLGFGVFGGLLIILIVLLRYLVGRL